MTNHEGAPASLMELEERLSRPTPGVIEAMARLEGDLLILGAGGKMGPSLSVMARRAADMAGIKRRVMAVSRFSDRATKAYLEQQGVEIISCDLLAPEALSELPDAENIVYMTGMKFGSTEDLPLTWAVNAGLPALVCSRFRTSRIALFSTGNIYGLTPVSGGGSKETDLPRPEGEYAMSALGRERVFEHFSRAQGIKQSIIRLNYACDLRYGVLVDIALNVFEGRPVPLETGFLNTIWQGDANAQALVALAHADAPPLVLNVTGSRILKVRDLAETFGRRFGKSPVFTGTEAPDALLSDSRRAADLFGLPQVEDQLVEWVADWVERGGPLLNKPTHFESRDGRF